MLNSRRGLFDFDEVYRAECQKVRGVEDEIAEKGMTVSAQNGIASLYAFSRQNPHFIDGIEERSPNIRLGLIYMFADLFVQDNLKQGIFALKGLDGSERNFGYCLLRNALRYYSQFKEHGYPSEIENDKTLLDFYIKNQRVHFIKAFLSHEQLRHVRPEEITELTKVAENRFTKGVFDPISIRVIASLQAYAQSDYKDTKPIDTLFAELKHELKNEYKALSKEQKEQLPAHFMDDSFLTKKLEDGSHKNDKGCSMM